MRLPIANQIWMVVDSMRISWRILILTHATLAVLAGCEAGSSGPDNSWWQSMVNQCSVNDDQRGSFMAPLHDSQVTIVVDTLISGNAEHGASWMSSIQRAADQWNDFGKQTRGEGFFTIETGAVPGDVRENHFADCQIQDAGTENHFYLMMETSALHWLNSGFTESIPGATVRCYKDQGVTNQVIMIRPDLVNDDQIMSIVLHEMGHSLGLDHSCDSVGGSSSFVGCAEIADDLENPYHLAVMYPQLVSDPTLQISFPVKEDLQQNDLERAKCFYQ